MDALDDVILQVLEQDGRLSMAAVGRAVGLSRTATLARVRRLERDGVIVGYHAAVRRPDDPSRHTARVGIVTDTRDPSRYVRRLRSLPEYREAETVAGTYDVLLRVEAGTAAALDAVLDVVNAWPETVRTTTFVVLRRYGRSGEQT